MDVSRPNRMPAAAVGLDWPVKSVPLHLQAVRLAYLCLKLRSWRLLGAGLVIVSLVSNNFFEIGFYRTSIDSRSKFLYITFAQFVKDNVLTINLPAEAQMAAASELKPMSNVSFPAGWHTLCASSYDCGVKHIGQIFNKPSKYFGLVDNQNLSKSGFPNVVCHLSYGSEMYCPFLSFFAYGLVAHKNLDGIMTLGTFRILDTGWEDRGLVLASNVRPVCATSAGYPIVFSQILTLQSMLVAGGFYFYWLMCCVAGICDLRGDGFLQLMFQRGLSIRAYWLAVWAISAMEVALFSVISIGSFVWQCSEFYHWDRLFLTFIYTATQMLAASSLCLLFTVTLRSRFLVSLAIVFTTILTMTAVLLNRLLLGAHEWAKLPTVILPFANLADFQHCALLEGISPNAALTGYYLLAFFLGIFLLLITVALTWYLDFVLKCGNGLRLPLNFCFDQRFFAAVPRKQPRTDMAKLGNPELSPDSHVQTQGTAEFESIVYTSHLCKYYPSTAKKCTSASKPARKRALEDLSVRIYKGQITALLGSNCAGKTTLLNILGSSARVDSGSVIVSGHSSKNPLTPLLLRGRFGVSPQAGALSPRLTVRETMNLLALSAGGFWRDYGDEAQRLMQSLDLVGLQNQPVGSLSRRQCHMLRTAMALFGPVELSILDEPTGALDGTTRMRLWRLLQKFRRQRTVLVSTQHIDEAAMFTDWMILLSKGSLQCAGSPNFFKTVFKCGLMLRVNLVSEKVAEVITMALKYKYPYVEFSRKRQGCLELRVPRSEMHIAEALVLLLEHYSQVVPSFSLTHESLQPILLNQRLGYAEGPIDPEKGTGGEATQHPSSPGSKRVKPNKAAPFGLGARGDQTMCQPENSMLAVLVVMCKINFKRSLRHKARMTFKIILPAIQLLAIFAGIFIEKSSRSKSDYNKISLTSFAFRRGICTSDDTEINKLDVTQSACKKFFKQASADNFFVAFKPANVTLNSWLDSEAFRLSARQHCYPTEPCPIVYMRSWGPANAVRSPFQLSIGVYIKLYAFDARNATAATVSSFIRVLQHMGVDAGLNVQGIFDFRMSMLPLFGIYFQLILLSTVPATFLNDLVEDAATKVRNQLRVIGMRNSTYWISLFIAHWLQYSIMYLCSVAILVAVMPSAYANKYYAIWVLLPTLSLGLIGNQLLVYNISTLFKSVNHSISVGYLLYAVMLCILVPVVHLHSWLNVALLFVVPQFAAIALSFNGAKYYFIALAYFGSSSTLAESAAIDESKQKMLLTIAAMGVHLLLYIIGLACLEKAQRISLFCRNCCRKQDEDEEEREERPTCLIKDEDFTARTLRIVHNPQNEQHILEVRTLTKDYPSNPRAVNCVTFALKPGEILGLVGPNDSGKSSIVRLLTGEEQPTFGNCEIVVGLEWLRADQASRRRGIGYCPQHDPLYDDITVSEHLHFYSVIVGLPADRAEIEVSELIGKFGLRRHQNEAAGKLSSGCRRRLSIAIALLGNRSVFILDDIFEGIDPDTKRLVCDAIKSTVGNNRSVILTSVSLEEAENLCDRVGILCDGYLLWLGPAGSIFDQYGDGYKLELALPAKATAAHTEAVIAKTLQHFHQASLVQKLPERVTFLVPTASSKPLSTAFHRLGAMKSSAMIEQFTLWQLSLDDALDQLLQQKDLLIIPEAVK